MLSVITKKNLLIPILNTKHWWQRVEKRKSYYNTSLERKELPEKDVGKDEAKNIEPISSREIILGSPIALKEENKDGKMRGRRSITGTSWMRNDDNVKEVIQFITITWRG